MVILLTTKLNWIGLYMSFVVPTTVTGLIILSIYLLVRIAFLINAAQKPDKIVSTPSWDDLLRSRGIKEPDTKNDKIVVVKNAGYEDVKKAVQQFAKLYSWGTKTDSCKLSQIGDKEIAITFPENIGFEEYCYFVNYLVYPENISYHADIKAWATTKEGDTWVKEPAANKQVMLFVPDDDEEYDNVYLTTSDGIGFKLGFSAGEESKLLNNPKQKFVAPTVTMDELKGKTTEEIK